jgi:3-methyladenine DNA glycosylase AlkD
MIDRIMKRLKELEDPEAVKGMARYGIRSKKVFGVKIPDIKAIAKEIGKDHALAQKLWAKGIRETMIIASLIDLPEKVTGKQMDAWVKDFNNWEVCDQAIANLFQKTGLAYSKAIEWSKRKQEFEKRAGYVMMARLAVKDKKTEDKAFDRFFPLIKKGATDDRNYVKKAVNWALRQIGKRNRALNRKAINVAKDIKKMDSKAARWVASDALRELTSDAVQTRLAKREKLRS